MKKKILIKLENLFKSYGSKLIANDLSFNIFQNEILVVLGKSGTGKSVFLKMLAGLEKPSSGNIIYDDSLLNSHNKLSKGSLGMVFQSGALFEELSVKENVAFYLRANGLNNSYLSNFQINKMVDNALHLVGLENCGDYFPFHLSGGMKKRVALARAIIYSPKLLLYDEPTTGLDPVNSKMITQLIKKVSRQEGITSIVVTHDLLSAKNLADRIVMYDQGKIIYLGDSNSFLNHNHEILQEFLTYFEDQKSLKEE